MRVQPRPLITVGLAIGYMAIVATTWAIVGLDYDEVGDTTSNIIQGVVVPVALGAVFLTAATSWLGWWGPAIHEKLRAPKWLWAVPALMFPPGLGALLGGYPGDGYHDAATDGSDQQGQPQRGWCQSNRGSGPRPSSSSAA